MSMAELCFGRIVYRIHVTLRTPILYHWYGMQQDPIRSTRKYWSNFLQTPAAFTVSRMYLDMMSITNHELVCIS